MIKVIYTILLFTVFLFGIHTNADCQTVQNIKTVADLEMKYWNMRGRLLGDENNKEKFSGFVAPGSDPGKSMVFGARYPFLSIYYPEFGFDKGNSVPGGCSGKEINGQAVNVTPSYEYRDSCIKTTAQGIMVSEENPLINHGNYIAVLATEFALLDRAGQDVLPTVRELVSALQALERLDASCEHDLYSNPVSPNNLNGLLMRDDIPVDFAHNNFSTSWDLVNGLNEHYVVIIHNNSNSKKII
jgi:hypothetical protein